MMLDGRRLMGARTRGMMDCAMALDGSVFGRARGGRDKEEAKRER
jgi:hypothetical protein